MCSLYEVNAEDEPMLLAANDEQDPSSLKLRPCPAKPLAKHGRTGRRTRDEEDGDRGWDEPSTEEERERAQEMEEEEMAAEEADGEFVQSESPTYVGQLLSYHVRKYADTFIEKMAKKNILLEVRLRKSVTAKGETKEWYQVVTKPYSDRRELELVVEQVSQEEKIAGAQIIVC